jgi:hypothetical protein
MWRQLRQDRQLGMHNAAAMAELLILCMRHSRYCRVANLVYATRRLWQGCQSRVWDAVAVIGLQTCATRQLWQGCQSRVWDAAAVAGLPLACMTRRVWSGCRHARRGGCGGVASHACQHAHTRRLRQGCLTYVSACAYVAAAVGLPHMRVSVRIRGGCGGVASHTCRHAHTWRLRRGCLACVSARAYVVAAVGLPRIRVSARNVAAAVGLPRIRVSARNVAAAWSESN